MLLVKSFWKLFLKLKFKKCSVQLAQWYHPYLRQKSRKLNASRDLFFVENENFDFFRHVWLLNFMGLDPAEKIMSMFLALQLIVFRIFFPFLRYSELFLEKKNNFLKFFKIVFSFFFKS